LSASFARILHRRRGGCNDGAAQRPSDSHDLVQIGSAWTALEMRRPGFDGFVRVVKRTTD
jgi:hypothetical protein